MHLTLTPQVGLPGCDETLLAVSGDILTVDGVEIDLSSVPDGGESEAPSWPLIGMVRRIDGEIHCTVVVQLGGSAAPAQPDSPWHVTVTDGAVIIPAARIDQSL